MEFRSLRGLVLAVLSVGAWANDGTWDAGGSKSSTGFEEALENAGLTPPPTALAGRLEGACPAGMATLPGFCIDRWEATVVDKNTGQPLSPYYTPNPKKGWPGAPWQYGAWSRKPSPRGYPMPAIPAVQQAGTFEPMAVTSPGVYPQGFSNHAVASLACENAGKRLWTRDEWYQACVGPSGPQPAKGSYPIAFPYGPAYAAGKCNFQVVPGHPLGIVGRSSSELDDLRLMLAESAGRRLLAKTGSFPDCKSGAPGNEVYDMVGNQDEVVSNLNGANMVFVGDFYSRGYGGGSPGCAAAINAHHASLYMDYSIGFRCCSSR